MAANTGFVTIGDAEIEVTRCGTGPALVLLPSEDMREANGAFVEGLARDFEVIIPSPPGFGRSTLPDWMTTVDDIAYVMLSLLDRLEIGRAPVIGASLGGWVAAEMATKEPRCFSRLVLIDPVGVKFAEPSARDIADIWQLSPAKVAALRWHDIEKGKRDTKAMSDNEVAMMVRDQQSLARFCWEPYMHNPKLKHRLDRITAPTLFLWGEHDGIAGTDYGHAYSKLISGAAFETVADAGHYPHLENPGATLNVVRAFLGGASR